MSDNPQGPSLFDPLPPGDSAGSTPRSASGGQTVEEQEVDRALHETQTESPAVEDMRIDPPRITLENLEIRDIDDTPQAVPQQILFEEPVDEEVVAAMEAEQPVDAPAKRKGLGALFGRGAERSTKAPLHRKAKPTLDPTPTQPQDPTQVPILARLTSGLLDFAAMLAVTLIALVGADLLGIAPRVRLLPGVLLFVLAFSFLYHVISLLFWGRTPGMASVGLIARDLSNLPLTAQQAAYRWLGSLATLLLAGIPMVVSWFTGRSLADSLAESVTLIEIS